MSASEQGAGEAEEDDQLYLTDVRRLFRFSNDFQICSDGIRCKTKLRGTFFSRAPRIVPFALFLPLCLRRCLAVLST